MMDKLRACIVANYYASAGLLKAGEVKTTLGITGLQGIFAKEGVEFSGCSADGWCQDVI